MAKIVWDQTADRIYETGADHGVFYGMSNGAYEVGVPWNGLTSVEENPSGGEPTAIWADNIKYLNLMSVEDFGFTINSYTYPDEFEEYDGSAELAAGVTIGQQKRKPFGFSYRTLVGDADNGTDKGYKLHLVYNCLAKPSSRTRSTVNDSPEASEFSWECSTTPVSVANVGNKTFSPTAHLIIDSTKVEAAKLAALETRLYGADSGSDAKAGKLPTPDEVITILGAGS